jgi:hypothetical protein
MKKSSRFRRFVGCTLFIATAILLLPAVVPAQQQFITPPRVVRITSPANHATFFAPVDIPIFAYVGEGLDSPYAPNAGSRFTNVDFYAGTTFLGHGNNLGSMTQPPPFAMYRLANPHLGSVWCFVWTNPPPATNIALTAVATGRNPNVLLGGTISRTSAPVYINIFLTVTNPNPVDVVSIVATDPIAVSGTNTSWIWSGDTNATPCWTNWPPQHWGSFTNWGPKDGLFTLRRFGDVSADLTVNFNIGGTASNGVDYAAISNSVTIPAGRAYGLIPIVPIDTNPFPKTAILTLIPDTNQPPDYVSGYPRWAEVLILPDWPRPIPLPYLLADSTFHLSATGPDGAWFTVQNSADLQNWTAIGTNQIVNGSIDFLDPGAPANQNGFYSAVPYIGTPPQ